MRRAHRDEAVHGESKTRSRHPDSEGERPWYRGLAGLFWSAPRVRLRNRFAGVPAAVGITIVLGMIALVVAPFFGSLDRWGSHDWDMVSSFRYLVVKSLKAYHQFPFWNPYTCGGYTAWGYVESDTNVISPWLPLYLLFDERLVLRFEVLGTALLSAWGTWLLAGRFTRSASARVFACIVFVVNGRWALQIATGHFMHCYYAWVPWAFYFFDRAVSAARSSRRWTFVSAAAVFVAMMVYTGAIYPLPQTLFALGLYSLLLAFMSRSLVPPLLAAAVVVLGLGLSAPKLLPVLDAFSGAPRLVDSTETMDLGTFVTLLTSPEQDSALHAGKALQWGWHEWGMYVGWIPFFVLTSAAIFVRGPRESALKGTAMVTVLLAFGAFHQYAPWTLLHQVSIFRSQHVPSRWLYMSSLLLGVVAAAGIGRVLLRVRRPQRLWLDVGLLLGLGYLAFDIGSVAQLPMTHVWWMQLSPSLHAETKSYHQESTVPAQLHYVQRDWSIPSLPAMISNTGVLECYAVVPMSVYARNAAGVVPGQGAKGRADPSYRGEFFTTSGEGTAEVKRWTPNEVVVTVKGAHPGDLLVMNQNYDPGWSADGTTAINYNDTVAAVLKTADATLTFRYRPRLLWAGIALLLATLGTIAAVRRRLRISESHGPLQLRTVATREHARTALRY
jgi:hypothetical protein